MEELLLVTIPALVAALGAILTAYVSAKVHTIARQTNGTVTELQADVAALRERLARAESDTSTSH